MTWVDEKRADLHKTFGSYTLIPQRHKTTGETAHLVDLGDRRIRVLPDEAHSGQKRATVVRRALEALEALNGVSGDVAETYLVGAVSREGLEWEFVETDAPDCYHDALTATIRPPKDNSSGLMLARITCDQCGYRWAGTVEPAPTDDELRRRGLE